MAAAHDKIIMIHKSTFNTRKCRANKTRSPSLAREATFRRSAKLLFCVSQT